MGENPNPEDAPGRRPGRPEPGGPPPEQGPRRPQEPYGPQQPYPPPPPPGWQPPPQWGAQPGRPPQWGPPQWGGPPGPMQPPPNNHMAFAIIATVLCCLPLGIVSIIKAAEVNSLWAQGQTGAAYASAESAKKWAWWSVGISIGIWLLVVIFYVAIIGFAATTSTGY